MQLEFPYQIVTFLDKEPQVNEPVYSGVLGWYPQLTIKRRFKLTETTEAKFIEELKEFFQGTSFPGVATGGLIKPERMPVQVIDVLNQNEMKSLHINFIEAFKGEIESRYPDREYDNYYAHITAEYNGEFVIPVDAYTNKDFHINNIWLIKDIEDENSLAFIKIH